MTLFIQFHDFIFDQSFREGVKKTQNVPFITPLPLKKSSFFRQNVKKYSACPDKNEVDFFIVTLP